MSRLAIRQIAGSTSNLWEEKMTPEDETSEAFPTRARATVRNEVIIVLIDHVRLPAKPERSLYLIFLPER